MVNGKQEEPEALERERVNSRTRWLILVLAPIALGIGLGLGDEALTMLASRGSVALLLSIIAVVAAMAATSYVLAAREQHALGHTLPIKLGSIVSVGVSGGVACMHLLREHGIGPELGAAFSSKETAMVGALAVLPSIFVSIVVSRLFPTVLEERAGGPRALLFGGVAAALLIHALPFVLPEPVEVAEVVEVQEPEPVPEPFKEPAPPPPPVFAYEKPSGLESAPVETWVVSDQKGFDGVSQGKPMAMSPDGRLFAYCQDNSLIVRDLNADRLEAKFSGFANAEFLRWSPDSNHLFYALPGKRTRVGVVQVDRGRVIPLPMPVGDWIPDGFSSWWADEEISFAVEDAPLFLNLDNLQVRPLAQSPTKMAGEVPLPTKATSSFPSIETGGFGSWLRLESYHPTPTEGEEWDVSGYSAMSLKQEGRPVRRVFGGCRLYTGDKVVFANDGSKLVRVRNGEAEVFYFGLSTKKVPAIRFDVPFPDRDSEREETFTKAMETHNVIAMIAGPMVNPLNGKVVGPNREQLRGMVRFAKVEGGKASLWITDYYEDIQEGDVVADVQVLEGKDDLGVDPYWFAPVPVGEASGVPIPSDEEAKPADFPQFVLSANHGAILLNQPVVTNKTPSPKARAVTKQVTRSAPKALVLSDAEAKTVISKFINEHHSKISYGNLQGFTDRYASRVKYYTYGTISDRAILAKQREHQRKYDAFISEEVVGEIGIKRTSPSTFTATYRLDLTLRSRNGKGFELIDLVTLKIKLTTGGPKITHQDSERESTKSL